MDWLNILKLITVSWLFWFLSVVVTSSRDIIINKDNLRYSEKKDIRKYAFEEKKIKPK